MCVEINYTEHITTEYKLHGKTCDVELFRMCAAI